MKIIPLKKFGPIVDANTTKLVNEGFFKSFPTSVVKKEVEKILLSSGVTNAALDEDEDEQNENNILVLSCPEDSLTSEFMVSLRSKLRQCGWYIADEWMDEESGNKGLSIEPKYPSSGELTKELTRAVVSTYKQFYHVTPAANEWKVMKQGLVPSNSNRDEFEHPDRIYLFATEGDAQDFAALHKGDNKYHDHVKKVNTRKIGNTGEIAKPEHQLNKDYELTIFKVDLFAMFKDGKSFDLYHDNRYDSRPVYFTTTSIYPRYLSRWDVMEEDEE